MEHMQQLFPYLWLLNAQTNSLLEPNELSRQLLGEGEAFRKMLGQLTQEELGYVKTDLAGALQYLGETRGLLERLEDMLTGMEGVCDGK